MNYLRYKEAFSALVAENDGVLPDLYEEIKITISCHPSDAPPLTTVADVVAYAIIEASHEFCFTAAKLRPTLLLPLPAYANYKPVGLEGLLTQASTSHN